MKRDMDLAREILFAIERSRDDALASIKLPVDRYDTLHLSHHIRLLKEGGLIHAIESTHSLEGSTSWKPHSLTWQGHDFLDLVRDDAVWAMVKQEAARIGGDLPSGLIVELATTAMRRKLAAPGKDVQTARVA